MKTTRPPTKRNATAETKTFALLTVRALRRTLSTKQLSQQLLVTQFKTRYNNHKLSFKDRKHSHDTVLSKHIWDLKVRNIDYKINWRIIKRASAYKGSPSRCNLCLAEKLCILTTQNASLLNKKSELVTKCRHENKFFMVTNRKKRPSNRS